MLWNSTRCLVMGAIPYLPFMTLSEDPNNPYITGGVMLEIVELLSKHMGFCYRYKIVDNYAGGVELPNGSWTGLIGEVVKGNVDMTGVATGVTESRFRATSASEFLYQDEWSVLYIRPSIESDVAGFVKPYTLMVWLMIMGTLVAVVGSMYGISSASKVNYRARLDGCIQDNLAKNSSPFFGAMLWTLSSLLSQSVTRTVSGTPMRLMTGLWLLLSLILATVYRSNLKAMLILPKVNLPFNNAKELADSKTPLWIPVQSVLHYGIEDSPRNSTLGRLKQQLVLDDFVDIHRGLRGLHQGDFAVSCPRTAAVQILHVSFSKLGYCNLYKMSDSFLKQTMLSLYFPKGSPLKAKFDPVIMRLKETGHLDRFYKKAVFNATECLKPVGTELGSSSIRSMSLGDFYGVLIIYAAGMLMAIASFIFEIMIGTNKN